MIERRLRKIVIILVLLVPLVVCYLALFGVFIVFHPDAGGRSVAHQGPFPLDYVPPISPFRRRCQS